MANDLNLRGKISMDAGPAEDALKSLAYRFRNLVENTRTTNKTIKEQATAMNALAGAAKKESEALIRAAKAQQQLNTERARASAIRSGARDKTNESNAKIEELQILGLKKQQTEEERAEGVVQRNNAAKALADERLLAATEARGHAVTRAAGVQELNARKAATEETRRLLLIENQAGVTKSRNLRDQVALGKLAVMEARALEQASARHIGQLSQMRYALYDVSSTARIAGAGMLALGVAPIAMAVSWEKAFADVVRTSDAVGGQVDFLKAQFTDLVQTLPVSWEKLTEIGTLAGQLGIAKNMVSSFTSTVAKFSATTDVSVNDAATAFGRLASLIPDAKNFQGVADSVLKVGVNSAATESQILKVATQISSLTGAAKFGYKETIGLAGALASVAVPPELSRGVITRVFGTISRSIGEMGVDVEKFGDLAGMSGKEFAEAWGDESTVGPTFIKLMKGIQQEGGNAETVLRSLGITSVRDVPILLRLANAADSAGVSGNLTAESFRNAADATGELQRQYGIISETTGAKIQVLFQNIQAALDAIGSSSLGPLSDILDNATQGIRDFTESLDETVKLFGIFDTQITNGEFAGFATVALGVVGVLGLVVAALGQVAGGMLAMKTLALDLKGTKLADMFLMVGDNARKAGRDVAVSGAMFNDTAGFMGKAAVAGGKVKTAFNVVSGAVVGLMRVLGPLAAIGGAMAVFDWATNAEKTTTDMDEYAVAMTKASKVTKTFLSLERPDTAAMFGFGEGTEKIFGSMKDFKVGLNDLNTEGGFWADTWQRIQQGFGTNPFASEAEKLQSLNFNDTLAAIDAFDDAFKDMMDAGNETEAFASVQTLFKSFDGAEIEHFLSRSGDVKDSLEGWLGLRGIEATKANIEALARGTLPAYLTEMSSVLKVQEETITAFDGSSDAVATFMDAVNEGSSTFFSLGEAYSAADDELKKWAEAQAEATESADDTWETFYAGQTVSLDSFLAQRQKQVDEQAKWAENLDTLLGQLSAEGVGTDISQSIISELAAGGKETAPILEMLVNGTPEQRAQYATQAEAIGAAVGGEFAAGLADAMGQVITQVALQQALITSAGASAGSALLAGLSAEVAPENLNTALAGFNAHFATLPKKSQEAIKKGFEDGTMSLADLVSKYDFEIDLTADTTDAEAALTEVNGIAEGLTPSFPVDADTQPAKDAATAAKEEIDAKKPVMPVDADTTPATTKAGTAKSTIDSLIPKFKVDANTNPAVSAAQAAVNLMNRMSATMTLNVRADIRNAQALVAGMKDANGRPLNAGLAGGHDGGYFPGYRKGGFTGAGGEWDEAGIVHRGEFVVTKKATERIGVQNLYDMMYRAQRGYQSGGAVSSVQQASSYAAYSPATRSNAVTQMIATLDAQSIQAIAQAVASSPTFLYTTDRLIAESAARGAEGQTQIGSN